MEMIINLNKLIEEKNKRAWTQGHLAEVCGLSLRTIQRIEKTGMASHETIKALASVFEISIEELIYQEINQTSHSKPIIKSKVESGIVTYFVGLINGKNLAIIGLLFILAYLVLFMIAYSKGNGLNFKGITFIINDRPKVSLYAVSSALSFFTLLPGIILLGLSQKLYNFNKAWSYCTIALASFVFCIANLKLGIFILILIALMLNWLSKKLN